jgi:hypothetical protein
MPERGARSAKAIGGTPATLYLLSENVDKTVAKAIKLGAKEMQPVMDMFWGDRCGIIMDPDGNSWMIATHIAEPTPQEMKKAMKAMAAARRHRKNSGWRAILERRPPRAAIWSSDEISDLRSES